MSMSMDEKQETTYHSTDEVGEGEIVVNASGHAQELDRQFGFWSIVCFGFLVDNAWMAGAGALVTSFYNGGGPGVIFELSITASIDEANCR